MRCPDCRCDYPDWLRTCPPCGAALEEVSGLEPCGRAVDGYEELVERVAAAGGELGIELAIATVGMKRTWLFPYRGYGFAWTQEMAGRCGERLALTLEATDIARRMRYEFPYQGFGYAWMTRASLVLSLA